MRKIIRLSLPIGLPVIFFLVIFSYVQASPPTVNSQNSVGERIDPESGGPRWFDEAWHYRRPVIISNAGDYLPYYQVSIKLNSMNFDFSRVNQDGSDIRFTDSSGKNPIAYWIESWDSVKKLAYVWVLVSSIPPEPYDTTIYLYYGNPEAETASSGIDAFDLFDDFEEFSGDPCAINIHDVDAPFFNPDRNLQDGIDLISIEQNLAGAWCVISGTPTAAGSILSLPEGTGIRTGNPFLYGAAGFRANYDQGSGKEWAGFINGAAGKRTIIGDLPEDVDDLYLIDYVTNYEKVILPRVGGNNWHDAYHIYELRWESGWSMGDIDHGASTAVSTLPAQVPNTTLPVTLYSYIDSNATMMVDWVYVRQYHTPEPSAEPGEEQGLVELAISNVDEPDPLQKGTKLTYQLIISNTSSINAPGVVVTDTLPGNILFGSVDPSQGSCVPGNPILCELDVIPANSNASITIVVTPTVDGVITNTAAVSSPGYELDLGDNQREQVTLVDSVSPEVNWEKPVHNGQNYTTYGGLVGLEALASDNDQVKWVQFYLWDHNKNEFIYFDPDYTAPYQYNFNSDILVLDQIYQLLVKAADRAGNISEPKIIWINRVSVFFEYLSIITK